MKKIKYNLEKNKKRLEFMKPSFEPYMALGSYVTFLLLVDLEKIFNISLTNFKGALGIMTLYCFLYTIFWFIDLIIYSVIENKRKKEIKEVENEDK